MCIDEKARRNVKEEKDVSFSAVECFLLTFFYIDAIFPARTRQPERLVVQSGGQRAGWRAHPVSLSEGPLWGAARMLSL